MPYHMGKRKSGPFSGQQNASKYSTVTNFPTFFLIKRNSTSNETFHTVSPFLVEKAITVNVKSTKKLRSGDLLVEVQSRKQSEQIVKLKTFSNIPVTVSPHASLNSSKGVVTCGELLNVTTEEILKELQSQGVSHVRRISIRRDGQLLNTKHLILTFDSAKLPEHIKAGYMRLSVRAYIPNPLRCFKCQRFGHSKTSCRGTLTCARCAEVGHESTDCTLAEKCVNCKGEHTSFSRNCSAWKQEKEIISTKMKKQISYQEARKLVKSQTPTPGNSYVSVAKKSFSAPSVQKNPDISISHSKPPDSTARASPLITNLPIPSSPSVSLSALKPSGTPKTTSVDTELLPMAVLPPLEKALSQSRESDADAEMSSSSLSEEDALEYDMSEDLEDSLAVTSPPHSSKLGKADKYKYR
ncbi:hypothetical protein AVEN_52563-1 [Araneus ventricosus]|uniref:CCHC-type domain-containing protein n=1 Tax=Araneus ventricosus TaxID=182803 RepID=A0A4Y2RZP5_ARAVE|nr:hypothetical protein AVEN_52563-1 [Araneus ventricosus]